MSDVEKKYDEIYDYFIKNIDNNTISHAYLIEHFGNFDSCYKMIILFCKHLLCKNNYFDNCSKCNVCALLDDCQYPELKIIEADNNQIRKDQTTELQQDFFTLPIFGKYHIGIIKSADCFNSSSANSILKFLEEPPDGVVLFLMTPSRHKVLPTIASRCQILSLHSKNLPFDQLIEKYFESNEEAIEYLKKVVMLVTKLEKSKINFIANKEIYNYKDQLMQLSEFLLFVYSSMYNNGTEVELYNDYNKDINEICDLVKKDDIIRKIEVLFDCIKTLNFNVNKDLYIDNLFLSLVDKE